MKPLFFPLWVALALASGCSSPAEASTPIADRANLAHGADLGWLTWIEAQGYTWVDGSGTTTDPLVLLKVAGVDSVRLRVMVNPSTSTGVGYADTASVVAMAQRCQAAGLTKLLVDFHFSDTWADPAHQSVPAAWASDTPAQAAAHVAAHVTTVLQALKTAGVTPTWVQLGNEETQGVLWSVLGQVNGTSGWANQVLVLNAGYAAVKAVDPSIAVILHLDRGYDQSLLQWWFDNYQGAGGRWDVIGLSFYPYWQPAGTVSMLQANLNAVAARYGKPVMVVEVGGLESDPVGTRALLTDVKAAVASVPGEQGLGLFYWEPDSNQAVTGYALGASQTAGTKKLKFTEALLGLGYSK